MGTWYCDEWVGCHIGSCPSAAVAQTAQRSHRFSTIAPHTMASVDFGSNASVPRTSVAELATHQNRIIDVRSPLEFMKGHIPGAHNVPLLHDAHRAQVGILYKQNGRDAAIRKGLELVAPALDQMVQSVSSCEGRGQLIVYCARGGMRSKSTVQLLERSGLDCRLLTDGYKGYRQWVRQTLALPKHAIVLGGATGVAKTEVLHAMARKGAQVVDLEGLAGHRGSVFGGLGMPQQPSSQLFENRLAEEWMTLNAHQPVWIEAESAQIGQCRVPPEVLKTMSAARMIELQRPQHERVAHLVRIYGSASVVQLVEATERIRDRLGHERTADAVPLIETGQLAAACAQILEYYDKAYRHAHKRRAGESTLFESADATEEEIADRLLAGAFDSKDNQCDFGIMDIPDGFKLNE